MKISPARRFLLAVFAVTAVLTAVINFGNRYLAFRWREPPGAAFEDSGPGKMGPEGISPDITTPEPAAKPDTPPATPSSKQNSGPVYGPLLWADLFGKTIYMAFYGGAKPPRVTWHHEVIERYPYPVIVHPDSNLPPGEEKTVIAGAEGLTVRAWVTVQRPSGPAEIKESRIIFYAPLPQIVEQGGS